MQNHQFDLEPPHPLPTSPRGHLVAQEFGLQFDDVPAPRTQCCRAPLPSPGQILLLGGASGSGKSSLLRSLARRARRRGSVINLRTLRLPATPVIDLFGDEPIERSLRRLSRVGLAEAWTWLRTPRELSEGQRWRLRLALALQRAETGSRPTFLVCDEFAAVLDRVSAMIVAAALRRAVDENRHSLAALIATSHGDLDRALKPDVRIECDFGQYRITHRRRGSR